jgi:hypothetical protein
MYRKPLKIGTILLPLSTPRVSLKMELLHKTLISKAENTVIFKK